MCAYRCLIQLHVKVEYKWLKNMKEHKLQWGDHVHGMCSYGNILFTVETQEKKDKFIHSLCAYDIRERTPSLKCHTKLEVKLPCRPRVDGRTRRVYVPCRRDGLLVFRYNKIDNRFDEEEDVGNIYKDTRMWDVAINSSGMLYGSNWEKRCVDEFSLTEGEQGETLFKSPQSEDGVFRNMFLAVLGDRILLSHGDNELVLCKKNPSTGKMQHTQITVPGLKAVSGITTDGTSHFLLSDSTSMRVFVLDVEGELRFTIVTDCADMNDCAVVGTELWVGRKNKYIRVMAEVKYDSRKVLPPTMAAIHLVMPFCTTVT